MFAEMLLEMNRPAEALEAFEATLTKEPNRFRAVAGAARAAKLTGDTAKARRYAAQLATICERADGPGRPELVEARKMAAR
jgi:predicted Zn-dependent protease